MTNPTSNFGWQMPTASDLVTDLPADFETFGQAVDTSLADLKGGTTGQILSKASGTDMDFTWITNDVGDITAVTAGTGLTGGGTSGAVTLSLDTTAVQGPAFRAIRATSTQSISANTFTKVQLNAEDYDTANCFDSTTNYRFTPNKAGYYQFNANALVNGNSGAEYALQIRRNGASVTLGYNGAISALTYQGASAVSLLYLNGSTDYVELWVYVGAGSPFVYAGAAGSETSLSGLWVRS